MSLQSRSGWLLTTALASCPALILAQESISFRYDSLGRLVETQAAGGAQNGLTTVIRYDPSGNRLAFTVVRGAGGPPVPPPAPPPPAPPPPPPPPSPPPGNSPPITVDDRLSIGKCGFGEIDVVSNDSDPERNLPLVLVSVASANPAASKGTATLVSTTNIRFEAAPEGGSGTDTVLYQISDSLGATATGRLIVTIRTGDGCTLTPVNSPP